MDIEVLKNKIIDLMRQDKELESKIPVLKKMSIMKSYPRKVRENFFDKVEKAESKLVGVKLHLKKYMKEWRSKGGKGKIKIPPKSVEEDAVLVRRSQRC